MRPLVAFLLAILALGGGERAAVATAATCSDYATQADAQRAADTRDADGDGIYCESLPCPCLRPGQSTSPPQERRSARRGCIKPDRVQNITFGKTKYPNIRAHFSVPLRMAGHGSSW